MKALPDWPKPKNWDRLWPALKGSLAKVHKPCIRPGCPQCASGDKHPAHLLSFSQDGKRRCMYVPQALVPAFQKALKNGRELEALLYAQGPQMLKEFRSRQAQQMEHPPVLKRTTKAKTKAPNRKNA